MAPKVSIVTCSYNRPELMRAAIGSLRAQTDPDWEHLIYDDASTDPRVFEVLEWALTDPRVRVWRGQKNLDQPSVLWNYMLDRAYGRYFTVLDDDNEKLSTFVEAMSRELDSDPGLDVVTCGWRVDRPGMPDVPYFLNLSTTPERLCDLSTCDGGAMLYRREVFERAGYFSEDQRTNEDWDWLRRAAHAGRVKNLQEVHSTYRSHSDSRMRRADALGNEADVRRVKARPLSTEIGVAAVYPPAARLTQSQRDVCAGVANALSVIPWAKAGKDLCLVVSPFQKSDAEIAAEVQSFSRVLSLHMEDPYALQTNLERVRTMARIAETWVCTNDAATVPHYQEIVGNRVIACPSLGADAAVSVPDSPARDIDVLFCGYAYPSRRVFMTTLLPRLRWLRVMLVGDGWEGHACEGVEVLPTQTLAETYRLHARARTVVCLHRTYGDCSDGPVAPATVNRGAMEGFCGPRVFVDRLRPFHAFDEGDVVWYDDPGDLSIKLQTYLALPEDASAFAEKCRTVYTYRARLARVINCLRAPRYLAEIP